MNKLICLGHLTNDRIVTPRTTVAMTGGVAYYFSYALAHLPKKIDYCLVTKVARADFDKVAHLTAMGVDVCAQESQATVFFENIYTLTNDERRQRVRATADAFTVDDVQALHADIFHLGTLLPADFPLAVVETLKQRGRVALDAQGFLRDVVDGEVLPRVWADKEAYLRNVDIINVNENELAALTGTSDPVRGSAQIAALGPQEVIVTLGAKGSLIRHHDELITIPAYPPRALVDPTGCGDTYMAGYLYCRTLGVPIASAGRVAAAMCTLKLTKSGAFDATIEDVKRVIQG